MLLSEAWLELHGVTPALNALDHAVALTPANPYLLERLASALSRAGRHREAAAALSSLGHQQNSSRTWLMAARAWLRAGARSEAMNCLAQARALDPEDPCIDDIELTVARTQCAGGDDPELLALLINGVDRARRRSDPELLRRLASDAWIESRGRLAGEALSEALTACGRPHAAVYVAAETAARALDSAQNKEALAALTRCALLAQRSGLPGEATAALTVLSLIDGGPPDAREALRDLLAERGRSVELAARLRADARRTNAKTRAAAWKGVAAIEITNAPAQAASALVEALRERPDDPEAFELLAALAVDPRAESALRDALWSLARTPDPPTQLRVVLWLAELEEQAGDPASAQAALDLINGQSPEASRGLDRLRPDAERLCAQAADALASLEPLVSLESGHQSPRQQTLDGFLLAFGKLPGAFRQADQVARLLAPIALRNDRFASLWTRILARSPDRSQHLAVLRRLATRCQVTSVRVRSAVAYAELIDHPEGTPSDAAELLLSLLDELPEEPAAAATLAAIAERLGDPVLSRAALRAVSRAATDPCERDLLNRFTGSAQGPFAVFASCLSDTNKPHERSANLALLNDLIGDSASILAHQTRLLLAHNSPGGNNLEVARRFSTFDPNSPEAAIKWFGAASLAGEAEQIALAARAVSSSLASAPDLTSVTRAAIARLVALEQSPLAIDLASHIAARNGAPDHSLRDQLIELVRGSPEHPGAVTVLEAIAAGASTDDTSDAAQNASQLREALCNLVIAHRRQRNIVGESTAFERLKAVWPETPIDPPTTPPSPEITSLARATLDQLESASDPSERRELHLRNAALKAAMHPDDLTQAVSALDQYACEQQDDFTHGEVTRALLSLGLAAIAVKRLLFWADHCVTPRESAARGIAAATIVHERLGDGPRALGLLREQLSRDEGVPEALALAERIAAETDSSDALFAIYDELTANAAGAHGRGAIAYRRACYLERAGFLDAALDAQLALFESSPTLGASFSAVKRISEAVGRYEPLARALTLLAELSPTPESSARFYRSAAEVARSQCNDPRAALALEVVAYSAHPEENCERALIEHARALRATHPEEADGAVKQVIDQILAAGNQTWDDSARRAHALHAAELAITEADDPERAADSVGLFMGQHEDPAHGRSEILDLIDKTHASEKVRRAVERVHGISSPSWRAAPSAQQATTTPQSEPTEPPEDPEVETGSLPPPPPIYSLEPAALSSPLPPRPEAHLASQRSATELRAASSLGDDDAAAALATQLSSAEDSRDEALAIQRQRFTEEPSRLDALVAMVKLYRLTGMRAEGDALQSVYAVLSGGSFGASPPLLQDLADPPTGVARVLFPPRWSAFAELGGLLWQSLGHLYRRSITQSSSEAQRAADPSSEVGRMFHESLRLLELPLTTRLVLREEVTGGAAITLTQPPGVALTRSLAANTPRTRFLLGRMLEGARPAHCLIAALDADEAQRLLDALVVSVGAQTHRPDGLVRQLATNMVETITPRTLKRIEDIVTELGPRLSYSTWHNAIELSRIHAGMLLSGDFQTVAREVLGAHPNGGAAPEAIRVHEGLRELARFACSEVYLLLRWQKP